MQKAIIHKKNYLMYDQRKKTNIHTQRTVRRDDRGKEREKRVSQMKRCDDTEPLCNQKRAANI